MDKSKSSTSRRSLRSTALKAKDRIVFGPKSTELNNPIENVSVVNVDESNNLSDADSEDSMNDVPVKRREKNGFEKHLVCGGCFDFKEHYAKGTCSKCYQSHMISNKAKMQCVDCKEVKTTYLKQKCRSCYSRKRNNDRKLNGEKNKKICTNCSELRIIYSKGMCDSCYQKQQRKRQKLDNKVICIECGEFKAHCSKGKFYHFKRKQNKELDKKICVECKEITVIHLKGKCR